MPAKVYALEIDFSKDDNFAQSVARTQELRGQIFELALKSGEQIFFHRYTDNTIEGAPRVLLECSAKFLEQVKKLPLFGDVHELTDTASFRAGHGGPINRDTVKRVLAQPVKDPSLAMATLRLQDEIIDLAQSKGLEEQVLVRHVDVAHGFISLLCPDYFTPEVEKLSRCRAIVNPAQAKKIFHNRRRGP
jgi:hypothetical protein